MAHDPILETKTLAPALLRSRVEIPIGTEGVLYDGGRYVRSLGPADSLSLGERRRTLTLYLVDVRPHSAIWNVSLPTSDQETRFAVSVTFDYRVKDPCTMVENRVHDTEGLLARLLEPGLRRQSREFPLNRHRQVETVLEDAIQAFGFEEVGIELIKADVTMNLDVAARERVQQLDDLERAMRVPQLSEHRTHLPTREATYDFETRVALTYQVCDRNRLPTRTLAEAEEWLWRRVERALRPVSRRYGVDQMDQAEEQMQAAVEEQTFADHGLEVVSALVEISLDERAAARAQTLNEIRTVEEFEKAKASLDDWKKQRELRHQQEAIQFYGPIIQQGQWGLLALMLSQDPTHAEEILDRLEAQRRAAIENQMKVFEAMVEAGGMEGWQMEDQAQILLHSLLDQTVKPPAGPALPNGTPVKRLEAGVPGDPDEGSDHRPAAPPLAPEAPSLQEAPAEGGEG
jgi:hypothetical protein